MNQYLLLRDNKQTGPYSVEELLKKGLKPYDLVWLDGRSAAWRYPSEIAELKAFAPAVEEQPYDRFYKKPLAGKANSVVPNLQQPTEQTKPAQTTEAVVVNTPVVATTTQQPLAGKKIYVTLPAGMTNRTATTQNNTQPQTDQSAIDKATAEQAAAAEKLLNEKFARLREEKMRQAAIKSAVPATAQTVQAPEKTFRQEPIPQPVVVAEEETPAFSTTVEQDYTQSTDQLVPVIRYRSGNKWLMRSITAACLLLVGVIIGLVISNSSQQRDNAALDQLVKQLQERDRKNREAVQFAVTTTIPAAGQPITDEAVPADLSAQHEQLPVDQQQPATPAPAGNRQPVTPVAKEATPVKDVSQRQTVKVIPAVVAARANEAATGGQEAAKARKDIHQQVAVDANKYKIGVLGGISELQLTLSNNSLYPLDQVEVELRYLGPEKRVIKTQMLLFNDVAPGGQKTIEAPRTNRGVSVDYVITRINSKALGLAHVGY